MHMPAGSKIDFAFMYRSFLSVVDYKITKQAKVSFKIPLHLSTGNVLASDSFTGLI